MPRVGERSLRRMERSMRRHLAQGWIRGVFARPRPDADAPADEQVEPGPGPGTVPDGVLTAAVARAHEAALAGHVLHTWVLEEGRAVRIDARHGAARLVERDEAAVRKMMGGRERLLRPDTSAAVLRELEILRPDGTMNVRAARKYKQIESFVRTAKESWTPLVAELGVGPDRPLRVVDLACGNGFLTLALAEGLRLAQVPARVHGVELDADRVGRCAERARRLGWPWVTFEAAAIAQSDPQRALGGAPDLALALHACDTATDDALALALRAGCRAILVAPCCQAELSRQLDATRCPVPALAQGLLAREYAATLTDALRAEALTAAGYTVRTVQFAHGDHTAKNLMLRATLPAGRAVDLAAAAERLRQQAAGLGLSPHLLRVLGGPRPAGQGGAP